MALLALEGRAVVDAAVLEELSMALFKVGDWVVVKRTCCATQDSGSLGYIYQIKDFYNIGLIGDRVYLKPCGCSLAVPLVVALSGLGRNRSPGTRGYPTEWLEKLIDIDEPAEVYTERVRDAKSDKKVTIEELKRLVREGRILVEIDQNSVDWAVSGDWGATFLGNSRGFRQGFAEG